MGAYTFLNDKKYKFWKVENISKEELYSRFPEMQEYDYRMKDIEYGTILFSSARSGLYIKAKEGIIEVLEIQGENAKRMNIHDFLRGNELIVGSKFE